MANTPAPAANAAAAAAAPEEQIEEVCGDGTIANSILC